MWQAKTKAITSEIPQAAKRRSGKEVEEMQEGEAMIVLEEGQGIEPEQLKAKEAGAEENADGELVGEDHYEVPDPPPLK